MNKRFQSSAALASTLLVLLGSSAFAAPPKKPPPKKQPPKPAPAQQKAPEPEPPVIEIEPEPQQPGTPAPGAPPVEAPPAPEPAEEPIKADAKAVDSSWQDVVVVVRKPFLKNGRIEFQPLFQVTLNDNMIRHYAANGQVIYWLTDILGVGVEGSYYTHFNTFLEAH